MSLSLTEFGGMTYEEKDWIYRTWRSEAHSAKAIRQYYPDYQIVAFDKNKETLALATQESLIDVAATTIDENFRNCRYIFLCAPVSYNNAYLPPGEAISCKDTILTDVEA